MKRLHREGADAGSDQETGQRQQQTTAIKRMPLAPRGHGGQYRPGQQHRTWNVGGIDEREDGYDNQRETHAYSRLESAAERHDRHSS